MSDAPDDGNDGDAPNGNDGDAPDDDNGGDEACANCGKTGSDTVKLKDCTACRLVKYCCVDCQKAHRKQHKKACKQRAAEIKDEQLYSQGHERPEGDFCSICYLYIPLPMGDHSLLQACRMKKICHGCNVAAQKRRMNGCAFCRTPFPDSDVNVLLASVLNRVEKKDPDAINLLGEKYFFGEMGLQKDMRVAVELYTEAAELGSIKALFNLGDAHYYGDGTQEDKAKATEFYNKAAMQGHVESRYNLGCFEVEKRNHDRALKHFLISSKMGHKGSLETIKKMFMKGVASKEQYAEAIRGYHDAVEETNSYDRDEAQRDIESRK